MGWSEFDNGSLLAAAENDFDALITTDQSMRYQQNPIGRRLAILVLPTTNWPANQGSSSEDLGCGRQTSSR
jgi:hypothetical protein